MKTYNSYDEAERDPDLDLRIIWRCDRCGHEYTDRPGYNEGQPCSCGGVHIMAGESYNG